MAIKQAHVTAYVTMVPHLSLPNRHFCYSLRYQGFPWVTTQQALCHSLRHHGFPYATTQQALCYSLCYQGSPYATTQQALCHSLRHHDSPYATTQQALCHSLRYHGLPLRLHYPSGTVSQSTLPWTRELQQLAVCIQSYTYYHRQIPCHHGYRDNTNLITVSHHQGPL